MLIVEDPTVTVKCRITRKVLFLYFNFFKVKCWIVSHVHLYLFLTNVEITYHIEIWNMSAHMNLKLNMKDINKILAKAHFKCNFCLNDAKKQHFCGNKSLWIYWKFPCHAFTSPSCYLFLQVCWALHFSSKGNGQHSVCAVVVMWTFALRLPL